MKYISMLASWLTSESARWFSAATAGRFDYRPDE